MTEEVKRIKRPQMSKAQESLNLMRYGTKVCDLTPAAVLQAAKTSVANYRHNRWRLTQPKTIRPGTKPVAFLGAHVRDAKSAADVLLSAIQRPVEGQASRDRNMAMLYNDVRRLWQALALAEQEAKQQHQPNPATQPVQQALL